MALLPGVYKAQKKDGSIYFRSSITYQNKHISLGSYSNEKQAHLAYQDSISLLESNLTIEDYDTFSPTLAFKKWVVLTNFRDNGIYIKTPIYIYHRYFVYYIDKNFYLKFDVDDLFYYSTHSIMRRGGHLFVSDFGMQVNILSRYGIKNYAVAEKDYRFMNGDDTDYRYGNIEIINRYHGVSQIISHGRSIYLAKIHIQGDYIIGRYSSDTEAAIAYNKAAKHLKDAGYGKRFPLNYIDSLSAAEYNRLFQTITISKKIRHWKC